MKNTVRFTSMLLALLMVLSAMPLAALAEGISDIVEPIIMTQITDDAGDGSEPIIMREEDISAESGSGELAVVPVEVLAGDEAIAAKPVAPVAAEPLAAGNDDGEGHNTATVDETHQETWYVYTIPENNTVESGNYLIVNIGQPGSGYALASNNGSVYSADVTVKNLASEDIAENDTNGSCYVSNVDTNAVLSVRAGQQRAGQPYYEGETYFSVYITKNNYTLNGSYNNTARFLNNGNDRFDEWFWDTSEHTLRNRLYWDNGNYREYQYNWYLRFDNGWSIHGYPVQDDKGNLSYANTSVHFYKETGVTVHEFPVYAIAANDIRYGFEGNGSGHTENIVKSLTKDGASWNGTVTYEILEGSDDIISSINNGTVTFNGNAGSATVRVSYKVNDATTIYTDITVTAVQRTATLEGAPVYVPKGGTPDYSVLRVVYSYSDGSPDETVWYDRSTFTVTPGSSFNNKRKGTYPGTVAFEGYNWNIDIIVSDYYDYGNAPMAEDYAEYPNPGAVRIDKTATYEETSFAESGITRVELDVAGVAKKMSVDVVLIVDVSNSMTWSMDWWDKYGEDAKDHQKDAGYQQNDQWWNPQNSSTSKFDMVMNAASEFADILLPGTDNSMSFVTFGGYDRQHAYINASAKAPEAADSVKTVFAYQKENKLTEIKRSFSLSDMSVKKTYNDDGSEKSSIRYLRLVDINGNDLIDTNESTRLENRGDTCYDYGFKQAEYCIHEIWDAAVGKENATAQEYNETGRALFVVFMTDGAASMYNNGYWRNDKSDVLTIDNNVYTTPYGIELDSNNSKRTTKSAWTNYLKNTRNSYAETICDMANGGFYTLGFDMAHGGFNSWTFSQSDLKHILEHMVSGNRNEVKLADNEEELLSFYRSLASFIREAGSMATVTDNIKSDFTLQIANVLNYKQVIDDETQETGMVSVDITEEWGFTPDITIRKYELYAEKDVGSKGWFNDPALRAVTEDDVSKEATFVTKDGTETRAVSPEDVGTDAYFEGYTELVKRSVTADDIGTRKLDENGKEIGVVLEVVTFDFDDSGNLTANSKWYDENGENEATLSDIANSADPTKVTRISGHYFTYTKDRSGKESFSWDIGGIPNSEEVTLTFYELLKGSNEGKADKGLYDTNESATLQFLDYKNRVATMVFPLPKLVWGDASIALRYYYVDKYGRPVNSDGVLIDSIANRVYVGDTTVFTCAANELREILAQSYVPEGCLLYWPSTKVSYNPTTLNNEGENVITLAVTRAPRWSDTTSDTPVYYEDAATNPAHNTNIIVSKSEDGMSIVIDVAVVLIADALKAPFAIPGDRVVIDYGKPVSVNSTLDTAVVASMQSWLNDYTGTTTNPGTIKAKALLDYTPGWTEAQYKLMNESSAYASQTSLTGSYGTFAINPTTQVVSYTPTSLVNAPETVNVVYEVKRVKPNIVNNVNVGDTYTTAYLMAPLTVIPATNVYYETDFADGAFILDDSFELVGTANTGNQDYVPVGGTGVTYGYDASYANRASNTYSNNSCWMIDNTTGAAIDDAVKFTFTGTGFDIFSRTGVDQGTIRVTVTNTSGTVVKAVTVLNKSDGSLEFYQIPVVSIDSLPYGTYNVSIRAYHAYTSKINPALNRGGEFYFDAVRVYDPAKGDPIAEQAYSEDNELNPEYTEVRNLLLTSDSFGGLEEEGITIGAVYVDYSYPDDPEKATEDQKRGVSKISDYRSVGPDNETYLKSGQAIAFTYTGADTCRGVDIGMKTIVDGSSASALIFVYRKNGNTNERVGAGEYKSYTVASGTEQYYPIANENELQTGDIIVVMNDTDATGILSLTSLKVVNGGTAAVASVDADTARVAMNVMDARHADLPYYFVGDMLQDNCRPSQEITETPAPVVELTPAPDRTTVPGEKSTDSQPIIVFSDKKDLRNTMELGIMNPVESVN